jgi:hypothetical protein
MFKEKHFCCGKPITYSKKQESNHKKSPWDSNIICINAIDNNWKQADTDIQYSYHGQKNIHHFHAFFLIILSRFPLKSSF